MRNSDLHPPNFPVALPLLRLNSHTIFQRPASSPIPSSVTPAISSPTPAIPVLSPSPPDGINFDSDRRSNRRIQSTKQHPASPLPQNFTPPRNSSYCGVQPAANVIFPRNSAFRGIPPHARSLPSFNRSPTSLRPAERHQSLPHTCPFSFPSCSQSLRRPLPPHGVRLHPLQGNRSTPPTCGQPHPTAIASIRVAPSLGPRCPRTLLVHTRLGPEPHPSLNSIRVRLALHRCHPANCTVYDDSPLRHDPPGTPPRRLAATPLSKLINF